jgi:hypothetical protein
VKPLLYNFPQTKPSWVPSQERSRAWDELFTTLSGPQYVGLAPWDTFKYWLVIWLSLWRLQDKILLCFIGTNECFSWSPSDRGIKKVLAPECRQSFLFFRAQISVQDSISESTQVGLGVDLFVFLSTLKYFQSQVCNPST